MITECSVNDLKISDVGKENPFCEGCILGKQHRNSFPKDEAVRAKNPRELFYADLCGKMSQSSIGGANYFLLLKDDYSKYCFVYFLKEKSDVLESLCKFYVDVRADNAKINLIKFRSDCGKKFCNESVEKCLLAKGIKHELSTPRALEQNGYIERQNRTIVESAKSVLHVQNLPRYLWAKATATAVCQKQNC